MSASSFCEARQKLSYEAFEYLLERANLEESRKGRFKGHRVRAVDGTNLSLSYSKEIEDRFPRYSNQGQKAHYPKARVVVASNIDTGQPTRNFRKLWIEERSIAA